MGVYVLVFPCISVDVCAYKSASVCVMVEVSFGNRLIITAAPSFIIFIEFFPASALGACKSYKFNTTGCRAFTVCVCVCAHACLYGFQVLSTECWLLLPTSALTLHFSEESHRTLWPCVYCSQGRLEKSLQKKHLPSEWLPVTGIVSNVLDEL